MTSTLANHLWQSTLFSVAAALLTPAFRRNRAAVRYGLWFAASVKFLVPFFLLISLGSYWHWPAAPQTAPAAPRVSFAVIQVAEPFATPPSAPAMHQWTPMAFYAVWACGFLAISLLRFRAYVRIRGAVRSSVPIELPTSVEVRSSPGLLEPGVVGIWRPVLLLPAGILERLTVPQFEAVLAHELCHVRRRDNLTASVHMLVEALFWFHPLVWFIGTRLVEERERACDEAVLTLGNQPREYAEAILNVCRLYAESPLVCVSGVTGANLKRRIEAIMMNRTARALNRAKKSLLAIAAAAALAGPILIGIGHAPAIHAQEPTRQLSVVLIDLSGMTADEQALARQAAVGTARSPLAPNSVVAILAVDGDNVRVAQDFTNDAAALESTIAGLNLSGTTPASSRLSHLETAVRFLGSVPGKKVLMYVAGAPSPAGDNPEVQAVIEAAQKSDVALYPIVPQPAAIYRLEGQPGVAPALVDALNRESRRASAPPAADAVAGFPGAHASIQVFAQTDRFAPTHRHVGLLIPLGSFSGRVDILGEILAVGNTAAPGTGTPNNHLRDTVEAMPRTFQADFMLDPASYVCNLIVREQSSGYTYGETISFTVN